MATSSDRLDRTQRTPRRILISGSTGFIGRAVAARRRQLGDTVVPLLRSEGAGEGVSWNPGSRSLDPRTVSGFDTVIHLAGEPVVGLWTDAKRQRIFGSRVDGTTELASALAAAPLPPRLFLCASGINFYGNRGDTILTEDAPKGDGFLADVCEAWERASEPAVKTSKVVNLRIGVVLGAQGGTLAKMLPAFRLGLGVIIGRGDGYISWVTLSDLVRVIDYLIETSNLQGSVNVVAPQPVSSGVMAHAIASALGRRVHFRLPRWPFRLLLGQLAEETILGSVRAVPAKLLADGFTFDHAMLEPALGYLLKAAVAVQDECCCK
jgi:uncharacterized protein (TIGR01777 family)